MQDERSWLGDPDAAARKERVNQSATARAARAHGARPFPVAATKVLSLTTKDDFAVSEVVRAVEMDAPLAARVLRLVNSPAFGLQVKCTSIRRAVTLLGSTGIREAVIAGSVLQLFPADSDVWAALHAHATTTATLARHLAPEWKLPLDEMFIAAFLHDIGKWVLLDEEPEYAEIARAGAGVFEGTIEAERERFGFDHAELAEHMLLAWRIPKPVPDIVGLHHDPGNAYAKSPALALRVAVLRLADLLANLFAGGEVPDYDELAKHEPVAYLGLSAESLRERHAALALLVGADPTGARPKPTPSSAAPRAAPSEAARPASPTEPAPGECAFCNGASFGASCPRCAAFLCNDHLPGRGQVCAACEARYVAHARERGVMALPTGVAVGLAGLAASLLSTGLAAFFWVGLVPGLTLVAFAAYSLHRRHVVRREFLAPRSAP